jgi:hypothetical protein
MYLINLMMHLSQSLQGKFFDGLFGGCEPLGCYRAVGGRINNQGSGAKVHWLQRRRHFLSPARAGPHSIRFGFVAAIAEPRPDTAANKAWVVCAVSDADTGSRLPPRRRCRIRVA